MSQVLMKSPQELKSFLAQRTVLDPLKELEVLVELLESPGLDRMPGRQRVEMLEVLWPSVRSLLSVFERQMIGTWQKHYYAENSNFQGFERLAKLTQQSYSAAALALHKQRKPWWGTNFREIALNRAIYLSAQIALARLSLYIPLEEGYWSNLYTLWREVEHADLLSAPLKESNFSLQHAQLGEILIGLVTLATLPTNALPSQEIRPLLACFIHFSSLDQLLTKKPVENTEWISIHFEHDLPPHRYTDHQQQNHNDETQSASHASRYIALALLTQRTQDMLDNFSGDFIYFSDCAVLISRATLERVLSHLQQPIKPRRERPKATGQCRLYSGISVIHRLLQEGIRLGQFSSLPVEENTRLLQPGIDTPPDATHLILDKPADSHVEELWDLVGRGHLIYEAPKSDEDRHAPPPHESNRITEYVDKLWNIHDISLDGICLDATRLRDDPVLSIGSLVLVEFSKEMSIDYLIGILRWEKNQDAGQQEIGIETLTHEAKPIRVSGSHQNTSEWHDALLIQHYQHSAQPLLVLPNQEYRIGASVMVLLPRAHEDTHAFDQNEPMHEFVLGQKMMQTASICVFQFKDVREMQDFDAVTGNSVDVIS